MTSSSAAKITDAAALAEVLTRYRVVDPVRLAKVRDEFPDADAKAFADQLLEAGLLTPFQAERALAGEARGLLLGPYRLTDVLSSENSRTFYAATDATDATGTKSFAIRLLPLRSLWQVRVAKRLVRALATLPTHPTLVPLCDVDSANGLHYLVWPRVEVELLVDRVRASGPLPATEAARFLRQLAEGLALCHRRGVEHGLLNPETVGIGPHHQARLLELGTGALLAQNLADSESMIDTLSEARAAFGMLHTAAPEVLTNPTALSPAADQYGLGIVAHFALTGLLPFEEASLDRTLIARQSPAAPFRDFDAAVPESLAAIVDRMLAMEAGDRFTSLDEVVEALTDVLVGFGLSAPVPEEVPETPVSQGHSTNRGVLGAVESSHPSGAMNWAGGSSPDIRIVERDDSNDSIQFDLPDPAAVAELPESERKPAAPLAAAGSTPPPAPEPVEKVLPLKATGTPQSLVETHLPAFGSRAGSFTSSPTPAPDMPARSGPVSFAPALPPSGPDPGLSLLLGSLDDENTPPRTGVPTLAPSPESAEDGKPASNLPKVPTPGGGYRRKPTADSPGPIDLDADGGPGSQSILWKTVRRNLLFWQSPTDRVQVSLFGPQSLVPGQTARIEMFLHQSDAADNVRTMSRAFIRDAELIGTGFVAQEVARDSKLAVHVVVANAGLTQSMLGLVWRGQPHRLQLTLHIPWESPAGLSEGVVSVGQNNVRIGRIDFQINVLPRMS